MFKQFIHKGFSALLALLVLFSTVSFTVEKHFCGDTLIDVAIFTQAYKCGMDMQDTHESVGLNKHCCKDVIEFVEGQDQLKVSSFEDLDLEQKQFFTSLVYSYVSLFEDLAKHDIPHEDYSPPNIVLDIQLLNETFLI